MSLEDNDLPDDGTIAAIAGKQYDAHILESRALAREVLRLRADKEAAANLLAVIHRDGGHHTVAVGWAQSITDAERIIHDGRLEHDTLLTEGGALRDAALARMYELTEGTR